MKTPIIRLIKQDLAGDKPKWCSHMRFWSRAAGGEDSLEGPFPEAGGWAFKRESEAPCGLSADRWNFCPICGKERP
jgi:hypothetical protein